MIDTAATALPQALRKLKRGIAVIEATHGAYNLSVKYSRPKAEPLKR